MTCLNAFEKWVNEGHISTEEAAGHSGGNPPPGVMERLGFDFGWSCGNVFGSNTGINPKFERKVMEELLDGSKKVRDGSGVIVLEAPEAGSIPAEIDHLLKDRASWEKHFLPRLQFSEDRINLERLED